MRVELWFRLLNHLSLALACACLAYAELYFLPELPWALGLVLVLILLGFFTEGRWVMPAWAANVLGVAIAVAAAVWLAAEVNDPTSRVGDVPLPAALVPYMGPVLMALLLVKLFRPRTGRDFWVMQGIAALQVGLGSILVTGPVFGGLLLAYLFAALGCLALRHVSTEHARASAGPAPRLTFWLFRSALRWTTAVTCLAMALFLALPRGDRSWEPLAGFVEGQPGSPGPMETGVAEGIDLNHLGEVEVNDDVALTVTATNRQGRPKLDLPADQRWRGIVLEQYRRLGGVWSTGRLAPASPGLRFRAPPLPDLGPDSYFLDFIVRPKEAGGLFVADPARLGSGESVVPVVDRDPEPGRPHLFAEFTGTLAPLPVLPRHQFRYRQVCAALTDAEREWAPAPRIRIPTPEEEQAGLSNDFLFYRYYQIQLKTQCPLELVEWTHDLVRRLADERRGGLTPADLQAAAPRDPMTRITPPWAEKVARALADHLSHSGEYTYTLNLRREDTSQDPVVDFLWNVKEGNCDRYASALTLMLRAESIPARIVKGFRGAENQGDGTYLVRNSHAHSWVEALVLRADRTGRTEPYWLILDPTPGTDAPERPAFSLARLWEKGQRMGAYLWRELIVDYNADHQADVWQTLTTSPTLLGPGTDLRRTVPVLVVAATVAAAAVALRRRRRGRGATRARARPIAFPLYARLLEMLGRYRGLRPEQAQTPREFGAAAAVVLAGTDRTAALADLPGRVIELFYRVRFGGRTLEAAEGEDMRRRLDQLQEALALSGERGT
jgi:transglutaminase-like putative cysteine protease